MKSFLPVTVSVLSFGTLMFCTGKALATCPNAPQCPPTLIRTVKTWKLSPPSPDPSGIAYVPFDGVGHLLIADGEVDETLDSITLYEGANLFETSLSGKLLRTFTTATTAAYPNPAAYSNEPAGIAYNPADGHLFISDDDMRRVFEVEYGTNNVLHTFSTAAFGNRDPEGLAFKVGKLADPADDVLFILDGTNAEVYKVMRGPNGVFDGVSPAGDDRVTHFDTESLGIIDPEGIEFDTLNRLFIVGKPETRLAHVYTQGARIRMLDISAANAHKPAGLALGPGSLGLRDPTPKLKNIYISDRGINNESDPNENDGKVYEFSLPPLKKQPSDNLAPAVNAGADQFLYFSSDTPTTATLKGIVVDDGLPDPPGTVTYRWRKKSGPGTVTFSKPRAVRTSAAFSGKGTYELQLTANDGLASRSDTVQVVVYPQVSSPTARVYVSTVGNGRVPGCSAPLNFNDEDIIVYKPQQKCWSMYFDGSDVHLTRDSADIDAFEFTQGGKILLSLKSGHMLPIKDPDTGKTIEKLVDDSDIVAFTPTSLGPVTAGSYELYFDGSDVGLDTFEDDVDSIGFTRDGRLLISTTGDSSVAGVIGFRDEDLLAFTVDELGEETRGTWQLYFDGSAAGLHDGGNAEDVGDNMADPVNGRIYLTTLGTFSVPGIGGDGADIFICKPRSIGPVITACTYTLFFDGSAHGLDTSNEAIDGFFVR